MTPTQAQIDAALDAFHKVPHRKGLPCRMKAALTAAVAAEVGEIVPDPRILTKTYEAGRREAIDRCADKVLELFSTPAGIFPTGRDIAAAIRALKDKP